MEKNIHYSLKILKINCYLADEGGEDEIFIKYDGKKIWPNEKFRKMQGSSEEINAEFKVEKGSICKFEVWDYDYLTPNDLLGEVILTADGAGGPYVTDMVRKGKTNSRYSLEWILN